MKKMIAFVLASLMLLGCMACGNGKNDMTGTYTLYAMDLDGAVVLTDELFEGENYVTLKSSGSAVICMENDKSSVKWKLTGTKLVLTAADGDMEGSISDGILTLVLDDSNLYFVAEGASTASLHAVSLSAALGIAVDDPSDPASVSFAPTEEQTELQKKWGGWWYGCIDINGSEKGWEWANGMTFDAAMLVELDQDGYGTLTVYDPYGEIALNPGNNNRYIRIECHATDLYLYGDSGVAFDYDINTSDWVVVRNRDNENKLNVGSSYTDDAGNKMGYDFTFLPWGDRWESENYSRFIPHFDEYLAMLDAGKTNPFDDGTGSSAQTPSAPTNNGNSGNSGGKSPLLGDSPAVLDVNGRGIVYIYYPADQFYYNDDYGKLKNDNTGVGILIDPMLGSTNYDELKASYEQNNSKEDDYSLTETTINGFRAMIMTYTDWLGATMRVDIDFGGKHDGYYGISFAVSGDSLKDCDSDLVWAIINSMELVK